MNIRKFEQRDLEQLKELDHMMWMGLQWNKIYHAEDTFVCEEDGTLLGMGTLIYDATWYYLEDARKDIPIYRMQLEIRARECEDKKLVRRSLLHTLQEHFAKYQRQYPDKKLAMRCWCVDQDKEEMQFYLENGFYANNVILVMGFDLTKDIPNYEYPKTVTIGKHDFAEDGMNAYMRANGLGFGVPDAEAELRFRLGDQNTVVFTARDEDEVIAATTVWALGDHRSAIENIFTIPAYRRQNLSRAVVSHGLQFLKERGDKLATLTCVGDNLPALTLYISMGFQLNYHMLAMHQKSQIL